MAGKGYARGFDSGFASDADYEDGFRVSDATIGSVAMSRGISVDAARRQLTGMDRLNRMLDQQDDAEPADDFEPGLDK